MEKGYYLLNTLPLFVSTMVAIHNKNGKEVTAIIELRARFDEESNIEVANKLQEAGAIVVYGIVGYKTHAKMILVVRRENNKLHRYVHLGTGNYHAVTARIYTDYGLLTANTELCEDVHKIFQELTGMGKTAKLKKLLHAPFTLHAQLMASIEQEIQHAKAGIRQSWPVYQWLFSRTKVSVICSRWR